MTSALFLQRDGVLTRGGGPGLVLLPGAAAVLRRLAIAGVAVHCLRNADPGSEVATEDARLESLLTEAGSRLASLRSLSEPRRRLPRPAEILAVAAADGIDLAKSWMVAADADGVRAAEQAGLLSCVLLEPAAVPEGYLSIPVVRAADLADAPRVMVPPGGGCWHEHRP